MSKIFNTDKPECYPTVILPVLLVSSTGTAYRQMYKLFLHKMTKSGKYTIATNLSNNAQINHIKQQFWLHLLRNVSKELLLYES